MAQTAIVIETPALVEVGVPLLVSDYDIQREINAAGAWTASFPATQTLAKQVRSRWRVSIIEEGRSGYLLRRGIVASRNYRVNADGTGILSLAGYSRLYGMVASSTHQGLSFDGSQTIEDIANELTGETVTVPASASSISPVVSFSEISKLAALLSACEMARYNLRETFDEDGFELVEQDDVPDSGFRFVNVQQAGPEIESAADNGMGLIAGTPTVGYDGKDLATRIIPNGTDFDGKPLNLGSSDETTPYTIQSALNPDGTSYYYIEDADAVTASGVVEFQYVRADVKNPSDNAGTKLAAANVLYAVAAGELIKRRYDIVSFACEIANGSHIDALPGDRVRIQFRGFARTPYGVLTWQDIDANFLIVKRRDASTAAGVRGVSFTLAAPEVPMVIPALPDAVPIPPPPRDVPNPPSPGDNGGGDSGDTGGGDSGDTGGGDTGPDVPPFQDPGLGDPTLPDIPQLNSQDYQNYQPCCAPPTDITDGAKPPPGGGFDPSSKTKGGGQGTSNDSPGTSVEVGAMGSYTAAKRRLAFLVVVDGSSLPTGGAMSWSWLATDGPVDLYQGDIPAGTTINNPDGGSYSKANALLELSINRVFTVEVGTITDPFTIVWGGYNNNHGTNADGYAEIAFGFKVGGSNVYFNDSGTGGINHAPTRGEGVNEMVITP